MAEIKKNLISRTVRVFAVRIPKLGPWDPRSDDWKPWLIWLSTVTHIANDSYLGLNRASSIVKPRVTIKWKVDPISSFWLLMRNSHYSVFIISQVPFLLWADGNVGWQSKPEQISVSLISPNVAIASRQLYGWCEKRKIVNGNDSKCRYFPIPWSLVHHVYSIKIQ